MNRYLFITLLFTSLFISACGSDNDDDDIPSTSTEFGVFVDSAVEGLNYQSGSVSGTTDSAGTFEFETGETVTFSIGSIILGSAQGAPRLTPVNLVADAIDETNDTVANLARFLQTLDDDGDPENGITITSAVLDLAVNLEIDFALSVDAFSADGNVQTIVAELTAVTSAGARSLVSSSAATAHLQATLIAGFAGDYVGTFDGDDSGSWEFSVNELGEITGTGISDDAGPFSLSGFINSDGSAAVGTADSGSSFFATISSNGDVTGSWENSLFAESGTISGTTGSGDDLVGSGDSDSDDGQDSGDTDNGQDSGQAGTISLSGDDTATIGNSLVVGGIEYGRTDLTNLETSVVMVGGAFSLNPVGSDSPFTISGDSLEGFVIVVGETSALRAISMTIVTGDLEFDYTCDGCTVSLDLDNRQVHFDNAVVENADTGSLLTLNGTVSWTAADEA